VALWIPPGGQLIGTIGALEAFDAANQMRAFAGEAPLYRLEVLSDGDQTRAAAGVTLQTRPARSVRRLHTLIVGGSLADVDVDGAAPACQQLARLARSSERIVSICAGAFWLGAVGALDGRRCTTHWIAVKKLARRFPRARVELDDLFVEDGNLYTSAGGAAGIDLALHLVRQDGGRRLALRVARSLVVFNQRSGGQSQFSAAVSLPAAVEDRIRTVVDHVVNHPEADHSVETMARRAGMSARHFARRFRDQTRTTPAAFVVRARVEAAQRLLADGDHGLKAVAADAGFGSVESLRRAFKRVAGVGPDAYRQRFNARAPS